MRIKILKDHRDYKKGEIVEVSPNIAFGLIDQGLAQMTKDMSESDYKVKKVKKNG